MAIVPVFNRADGIVVRISSCDIVVCIRIVNDTRGQGQGRDEVGRVHHWFHPDARRS